MVRELLLDSRGIAGYNEITLGGKTSHALDYPDIDTVTSEWAKEGWILLIASHIMGAETAMYRYIGVRRE